MFSLARTCRALATHLLDNIHENICPRVALEAGGASVRRAWTRLDRDQATIGDVHTEEDGFTTEVLKEQGAAGIDVVTDGQVRWDDAQTYWARGIEGLRGEGVAFRHRRHRRDNGGDGRDRGQGWYILSNISMGLSRGA